MVVCSLPALIFISLPRTVLLLFMYFRRPSSVKVQGGKFFATETITSRGTTVSSGCLRGLWNTQLWYETQVNRVHTRGV